MEENSLFAGAHWLARLAHCLSGLTANGIAEVPSHRVRNLCSEKAVGGEPRLA